MILYHGSAVEDFVPTFGLGREKHDYGKVFYLTEFLELAREWSVAADPLSSGWVHAYDLDLTGLRVLDFTTLSPLAWLAELMKHRDGDNGKYYRENAPLLPMADGRAEPRHHITASVACDGRGISGSPRP